MAKTFEAIQKSKEISVEINGVSSYLTQWNFLNLQGKRSLSDILSKISIAGNSNGSSTFHFASASEGEGTSTILVNLVRILIDGKSLENVLVIDGNFESPIFHLAFNLPLSPGFSEVLKKEAKVSEAIHRLESSSVYIMPCGGKLLGNQISIELSAVDEFIKKMQQKFKFIIVDSPPLLTSPIALLWANAADVSFLVIQANRTQWEVARKAQVLLEKHDCNIGGVVLNKVHYSIPEWIYKRL